MTYCTREINLPIFISGKTDLGRTKVKDSTWLRDLITNYSGLRVLQRVMSTDYEMSVSSSLSLSFILICSKSLFGIGKSN